MGLIISTFEHQGNDFENAYAKIDRINYDNNTKIISFSLAVYKSKTDKNKIKDILDLWAKAEAGVDYSITCYNQLNAIIATKKASIAQLAIGIEDETDSREQLRLEALKAQMENNELLQFDGAVSDEVVTE